MDAIYRAIDRKLHISGDAVYDTQTYEAFFDVAQGKQVFLYGIGGDAGEAIEHCATSVHFDGIIDGDSNKQGFPAGEFVAETVGTEYEEMIISAPDVLDDRERDCTVVVITSTMHHAEISKRLNAAGFKHIFIMLMMEANRIKGIGLKRDIDNEKRAGFARNCAKMPIEKKKIVFFSMGTYSDHGKYIAQKLVERKCGYDIVWILSDINASLKEGMRSIYMNNWKKYIYEMETAEMWVFDMVLPSYIIKRPGQIYVQTTHWGSILFKRAYLDSNTLFNVSEAVENWRYNGRIMDYLISGSDIDSKYSSRGFGFDKTILQIGSPRTDILFEPDDIRKKIYEKYGIKHENRVLIYAPTYRFMKGSGLYAHEAPTISVDFEGLMTSLKKRFGGMWTIMLRLHPSVSLSYSNTYFGEDIVNVSDHEDSQELLAASDIMLSDYSAIMFEMAFVGKPIFVYADDADEYVGGEYEAVFSFEELPFPFASKNESLQYNIEEFDEEKYKRDLDVFLKKCGAHEDGHASDRAADEIVKIIGE